MTDEPTREERLAAFLDDMRRQHPHQPNWHWKDIAEKARLQWKVDDLRHGIAWLVGAYGFHAEQQPENAHLVALVADLSELLKQGRLPAAQLEEVSR